MYIFMYTDDMEKGIRWKIVTILILSVTIFCLLLILGISRHLPALGKSDLAATSAPSPSAAPLPSPLPTPTSTPIPTPQPTPEVDITSDDSLTRIINLTHPISADYVPADLRKVNVHTVKDVELRDEAAGQLEKMFQDAIQDRIYLKLVDGYRSYALQQALYSYYARTRGKTYADNIDDHPGASEHQLGLGADLGNWNGACELSYCFTQYHEYDWLLTNGYKYGWILRYPENKQDITGIMYSPWHFRYLGVEEATKIHDSGLTMEEYYGVTATPYQTDEPSLGG